MKKKLSLLIIFIIVVSVTLVKPITVDNLEVIIYDNLHQLTDSTESNNSSISAASYHGLTSISVINNFGKNPATERNFTWNTPISNNKDVLEYCLKDEFHSFDDINIKKVTAKSYETKTDADNRVIHKISLKNLKPGAEYIYRIMYAPNIYSPKATFKTAEEKLDQFTFIQITDTQGFNKSDYLIWANTLKKALGKFPDAKFLIHTGDMVNDGDKIKQWDAFTHAVIPELMNLPIAPTLGNHDKLNKNGSNPKAKNFNDIFYIPNTIKNNTGTEDGTVYSFDYGNAHIAVMNTECSRKNLKKQGDWLISDMSKTDKLWKIVAVHRGLYGATYYSSEIRDVWAPIFDKVGIDLVLQGHDHNYVRTYPMKNNEISSLGNGTIYITANSGGIKFYPQKLRNWQEVNLQPYIQMYIAVTINNNQITIKAYDVNNVLKDTITLNK
ncbi:purple acid phosphatase family protein [Anaerovorax odorimutans]|uniref:purple acid phosphatase family protein n=1 Tax=Anaerovorax odorimutans TaxID=109327 RepID=UPI00041A8C74|nr:metallophosphoesterase family protein [Anaerovorax odorimutans]